MEDHRRSSRTAGLLRRTALFLLAPALVLALATGTTARPLRDTCGKHTGIQMALRPDRTAACPRNPAGRQL